VAGDSAAPAATAGSAPGGGDAAAAPAPAQIWTPDDSARAARQDSIELAHDYYERLSHMETYESCMAKAKGLEPGPRAVIEQACNRSSRPRGR